MSAAALETFLARLYTDADVRREFLADPRAVACRCGIAGGDLEAIVAIDRVGLELAAESYSLKRAAHGTKRRASLRERIYSAFASKTSR
jgi:hypothetical protein